mgnify:FL=1
MSEMITVGDAIARTLEQYHVEAIYGVISIHNLPIADAVGQREKIRFVPARGEAGSVTRADAHGRFSGLGVALTSTDINDFWIDDCFKKMQIPAGALRLGRNTGTVRVSLLRTTNI